MTLEQQPTLFESGTTTAEPSPTRVRVLAGVLAGFAWPGGKTTPKQQAHAETVARETLARLQASP